MILKGKALKDFCIWIKKRLKLKLHELHKVSMWASLQDKTFLNSLIIEFFDTVRIYIGIDVMYSELGFKFDINTERSYCHYDIECGSRQEATEKAIIKANEIYNEQNQ